VPNVEDEEEEEEKGWTSSSLAPKAKAKESLLALSEGGREGGREGRRVSKKG